MLTVQGTVMGRSHLYLKLDPQSSHLLGRRTLEQLALHEMLEAEGYAKGDGVTVQLEKLANGRIDIHSVGEVDELVEGYTKPFDTPTGLFPCVPPRDTSYLIPGHVASLIKAISGMVEDDPRVNIRLTGPQGGGKTSLAKAIAASIGYNFIKIDCGVMREPADWFCSIVAKQGTNGSYTEAIPSLFLHAITTPRTVVLLDEFNRTDTHNSIYGLLDEHGFAWSDDLQVRIDRAPQVLVIATMNVEASNVAVYELDAAIKDRFPVEIRLELLPETILARVIKARTNCPEYIADRLAFLAHQVEALVGSSLFHGTGTRPLIAAAKLMNCGIDWTSACSHTVAASFSHEGGATSQRTKVINLIMGLDTAPQR